MFLSGSYLRLRIDPNFERTNRAFYPPDRSLNSSSFFFLFSPLLPDPFALPILEKKLESLFGGCIVPILKLSFFLILPSFSSVPLVVVLFESTTLLHSFFSFRANDDLLSR